MKRSQTCPVPLFSPTCTMQQCHSTNTKHTRWLKVLPRGAHTIPSHAIPWQLRFLSRCSLGYQGGQSAQAWGSSLFKISHQLQHKYSIHFTGKYTLKDSQIRCYASKKETSVLHTRTLKGFSCFSLSRNANILIFQPTKCHQLHSLLSPK